MNAKLRVTWVFALLCTTIALPAVGGEMETVLRRAVAWQASLEASGYSPGLIDGKPGPRTETATREFQKAHGLQVTGELDEPTAKALNINPDGIFRRHTVEHRDLLEVGPNPNSWVAKSKLKMIGHEGLENVIAERYHCTLGLLATINPRKQINDMGPGDEVIVPFVLDTVPPPKVDHLEVNLTDKIIRVIGEDNKVVALFFCSVAKDKQKLPERDTEIVSKTPDPWYTFDPKMWPEVKEPIGEKLQIPPGPRNPVGRCWISLGLKGYGMHGTPNPELIGKTGSHGCFRLTNWDALRLARMVEVGTKVKFAGHPDVGLAKRSARALSSLASNERLPGKKRR